MIRLHFAHAALATVAGVLLLHWATSCHSGAPAPATPGADEADQLPGARRPSQAGPCDGAADPAGCYLERAWLIEELLGDLYVLEGARDLRSVPVALAALATGEPDVQRVALRVLGPFAAEPGVGAGVLPWLLADDLRREEAAAAVLVATGEPGLVRLGAQFQAGHQGENAAPALAGWWRDPARHGLAAYPGSKRFPPGDSARSIGLATDDPVDRVLAHYAAGTSAQPFDAQGYEQRLRAAAERQQRRLQAALEGAGFLERQKKLQALIDEYQRTQDPKLLEQLTKLGQEPLPTPPSADPGGALTMPLPPVDGREPMSQARWLVLEERDGVATRAVVAYPEPAAAKTVVILGWDPAVHAGTPDARQVRLR